MSPLDVLVLINDINTKSSRSLEGSPGGVAPFLDVNNDRFVSPLDVLVVINYLNRSGSAEGEAAPMSGDSNSTLVEGPTRIASFVWDNDHLFVTRVLAMSNGYRVDDTKGNGQGADGCGCGNDPSDHDDHHESDDANLGHLVFGPTITDQVFSDWN